MNKPKEERLGTVGIDRNIIIKVKIFCAKRKLTIRAWIEKTITNSLKDE